MKHPAIDEDLTGKIAIVTGATGGLGKEIARGLARMGATLIIGARNPAKGADVQKEIARDAKHPEAVQAMVVDVSSIASVRSFAADFEKRYDALHILVNNAGAWFSDRRESVDKQELTFATNVVGPYLLTKLLADRLRKGAPSRVVNVVSGLAANYDPNDLAYTKRKYDGFKSYGQSKQALRMVSWLFAAKFEKDRVTVNAAAPGFVRTDFNQNASGFTAGMINFFARFFGDTPAGGADTPLWAAASREVEGQTAKYFEGRKERDGKFRDPAALAELERALESIIAGGANVAPAAGASPAM